MTDWNLPFRRLLWGSIAVGTLFLRSTSPRQLEAAGAQLLCLPILVVLYLSNKSSSGLLIDSSSHLWSLFRSLINTISDGASRLFSSFKYFSNKFRACASQATQSGTPVKKLYYQFNVGGWSTKLIFSNITNTCRIFAIPALENLGTVSFRKIISEGSKVKNHNWIEENHKFFSFSFINNKNDLFPSVCELEMKKGLQIKNTFSYLKEREEIYS